jgi:hypothetical protein
MFSLGTAWEGVIALLINTAANGRGAAVAFGILQACPTYPGRPGQAAGEEDIYPENEAAGIYSASQEAHGLHVASS